MFEVRLICGDNECANVGRVVSGHHMERLRAEPAQKKSGWKRRVLWIIFDAFTIEQYSKHVGSSDLTLRHPFQCIRWVSSNVPVAFFESRAQYMGEV